MMPDNAATPLRILVIGAHPDDCDIDAGGTAALYRALGHDVRFVSVTNGQSGHHWRDPAELVPIRREEASRAGAVIGVQYDVLDFPDGMLEPTLDARFEIIRLIRRYDPDLILTHRPNDYHPDHRATSQLVCDAAYMVTVPPIVPDVPALRRNPCIAFVSDNFQRPYPFSPTVVVDIEPVLDKVVTMLDCHASQFYEWLAFNHNYEEKLPKSPDARKAWLGDWYEQRIAPLAERFRPQLIQRYGAERAATIRYVEAFEPCEYGDPIDESNIPRLFPFFPS